jgi:hypothetical protein
MFKSDPLALYTIFFAHLFFRWAFFSSHIPESYSRRKRSTPFSFSSENIVHPPQALPGISATRMSVVEHGAAPPQVLPGWRMIRWGLNFWAWQVCGLLTICARSRAWGTGFGVVTVGLRENARGVFCRMEGGQHAQHAWSVRASVRKFKFFPIESCQGRRSSVLCDISWHRQHGKRVQIDAVGLWDPRNQEDLFFAKWRRSGSTLCVFNTSYMHGACVHPSGSSSFFQLPHGHNRHELLEMPTQWNVCPKQFGMERNATY